MQLQTYCRTCNCKHAIKWKISKCFQNVCLAIPWNPPLPLQLDHVMQTSFHGSLASLLLCWCLAALWFSVSFHGHAIFINFHTFILGPRNPRPTNYSIHFIHICSSMFTMFSSSVDKSVPTCSNQLFDLIWCFVSRGSCRGSRLYIYIYLYYINPTMWSLDFPRAPAPVKTTMWFASWPNQLLSDSKIDQSWYSWIQIVPNSYRLHHYFCYAYEKTEYRQHLEESFARTGCRHAWKVSKDQLPTHLASKSCRSFE